MCVIFYYFNSPNYPIKVTESTCTLTSFTFDLTSGLWENPSLYQFFSIIDTESSYNIVDIGAQSGLYSLFAKYLPKSTFYSFEPYIPSFQLLNENILLNNLKNVKTFNIALSDKKATSELNVCKSHNGLHTMGSNPLRFSDIDKVTVETDTMDNLFYENKLPVHFIKIDTEGFEYFILKGGINTITEYKPVIQLEWNSTNMKQCNVSEDMLHNLLTNLSYQEVAMQGEDKLFVHTKFINFVYKI